jgi:hypothetical protein
MSGKVKLLPRPKKSFSPEFKDEAVKLGADHFEVMASIDQYLVTIWSHNHHIERRVDNATQGPWHPDTHVPCEDGRLSITAGGRPIRESMVSIMGLDELWDDPRFAESATLLEHRDEFSAALAPWFLENKIADVVELFQAVRVPAGPVRGMQDLLDYEQLSSRGFWSVPDASSGVRYPRGAFVRSAITRRPSQWLPPSAMPTPRYWRPSTRLRSPDGPHLNCATARCKGCGSSTSGRAGRVRCAAGSWRPRCGHRQDRAAVGAGPRRVSREYARIFHLYPAEDPGAEPWNREGMGALWSRNRRTVCMRFDRPEGRQVLERLIVRSDLLLENYSPRVLPNMALSLEQLQGRRVSRGYGPRRMTPGWSAPATGRLVVTIAHEDKPGITTTAGPVESGTAELRGVKMLVPYGQGASH